MNPRRPPLLVQERELTAEEAMELERERDRDERDALVERMMDKDKSKTKQMELGGLTPAQVRWLSSCLCLLTAVGRWCYCSCCCSCSFASVCQRLPEELGMYCYCVHLMVRGRSISLRGTTQDN